MPTSEDMLTTEDTGLRPIEIQGSHYHYRCAEEMDLLDAWRTWHGREWFADYAMEIETDLTLHEYLCAGCLEVFPFVTTLSNR